MFYGVDTEISLSNQTLQKLCMIYRITDDFRGYKLCVLMPWPSLIRRCCRAYIAAVCHTMYTSIQCFLLMSICQCQAAVLIFLKDLNEIWNWCWWQPVIMHGVLWWFLSWILNSFCLMQSCQTNLNLPTGTVTSSLWLLRPVVVLSKLMLAAVYD